MATPSERADRLIRRVFKVPAPTPPSPVDQKAAAKLRRENLTQRRAKMSKKFEDVMKKAEK